MIAISPELAQTRPMGDELPMPTPPHQLAGKVVIITGSVGNLGLVTAQELQKSRRKNRAAGPVQGAAPGELSRPG